jgi:hypothetical protein
MGGAFGARTRNLRIKSTLIRFPDSSTCADVRWIRLAFPAICRFRRIAIGTFIGMQAGAAYW